MYETITVITWIIMPLRYSPIRVKNTENGVNNNGCEVTGKFIYQYIYPRMYSVPLSNIAGKVKIDIRYTTRSGEHQYVCAIQTDREEKMKTEKE